MIPFHAFKTPEEAYQFGRQLAGWTQIEGQPRGFNAWYLMTTTTPSVALMTLPKRRGGQ